MNVSLPAAIRATMPTQYVRHLDNPSIAFLETEPDIADHSLEIVLSDSEIRWQYGSTRLRVNHDALKFASLSIGSFEGNALVFFSLHFGDLHDGGVRMLNASIDNPFDMASVTKPLATVLPCPVRDMTGINRP